MKHTHGRIALEIVFVRNDSNLGKPLAWFFIYFSFIISYKSLWILWEYNWSENMATIGLPPRGFDDVHVKDKDFRSR